VPVNSVDVALRDGSLDTASRLLKHALSTIQSPAFSQVTLLYQEYDFRALDTLGFPAWPYPRELSQDEKAVEASWHYKRFELLREVHKVRNFQLVLYANVREPVGEYAERMMKEAVVAEKARGGFNIFFPEPLVISVPRSISWVQAAL